MALTYTYFSKYKKMKIRVGFVLWIKYIVGRSNEEVVCEGIIVYPLVGIYKGVGYPYNVQSFRGT